MCLINGNGGISFLDLALWHALLYMILDIHSSGLQFFYVQIDWNAFKKHVHYLSSSYTVDQYS
jgi:hypothetical protein